MHDIEVDDISSRRITRHWESFLNSSVFRAKLITKSIYINLFHYT